MTLYGITWFHRHFLAIDPATAGVTTLSVGPHRDVTALAIQEVPEAEVLVPMGVVLLGGVTAGVWRGKQATGKSDS
jgi:hypothetical protein